MWRGLVETNLFENAEDVVLDCVDIHFTKRPVLTTEYAGIDRFDVRCQWSASLCMPGLSTPGPSRHNSESPYRISIGQRVDLVLTPDSRNANKFVLFVLEMHSKSAGQRELCARLIAHCGIPVTLADNNPGARFSRAEWQTRVDLAAAYRLADMFGFSDIIWNHITAKVPHSEHFLINRFGLRYDEVTASNLVTVELEGNVVDPGSGASDVDVNVTGFVIHSAVHSARPDIQCVMHSHSAAGIAVSVLKNGLVPMTIDSDAVP